jgi:hypothetical protein
MVLERTQAAPTRLRRQATTPRGVTAQAIASLDDANLNGIVARALNKSNAIGTQVQGALAGHERRIELVPQSPPSREAAKVEH